MALMTAYFDESGIHEGDHYCIVAGFVGNDAQWHAFAADWIPAIKPRKNLHLTKLRWNQHPERIAPLLARTGPIPGKFNLTAVAVGLKWHDYNTIVKGKIREKFTNPYMLCAHCAMAVVLFEVIGSNDVCFLFDRQEGLRRETMQTLRDFVFDWIGVDSRIKGLEFVRRESTVCLDPADYLAFILREQALNESSIKVKMGESLLAMPVLGGPIRPDQLKWMVDDLVADGFSPDKQLPPFPEKAVRELAMNPYWRGPRTKG
jgi:hypothetical protein